MSENELHYIDELITELNAKKSVADSISEDIERIKSMIRNKMIDSKLNRLTTPNHNISYSDCERTLINKQKLQSEFLEIFGQLAQINKYKVLRIN